MLSYEEKNKRVGVTVLKIETKYLICISVSGTHCLLPLDWCNEQAAILAADHLISMLVEHGFIEPDQPVNPKSLEQIKIDLGELFPHTSIEGEGGETAV